MVRNNYELIQKAKGVWEDLRRWVLFTYARVCGMISLGKALLGCIVDNTITNRQLFVL